MALSVSPILMTVVFSELRYVDHPVVHDLPGMHEMTEETRKPVAINAFRQHVERLHKDTNMLFAAEYEHLKVRRLDACLLSHPRVL